MDFSATVLHTPPPLLGVQHCIVWLPASLVVAEQEKNVFRRPSSVTLAKSSVMFKCFSLDSSVTFRKSWKSSKSPYDSTENVFNSVRTTGNNDGSTCGTSLRTTEQIKHVRSARPGARLRLLCGQSLHPLPVHAGAVADGHHRKRNVGVVEERRFHHRIYRAPVVRLPRLRDSVRGQQHRTGHGHRPKHSGEYNSGRFAGSNKKRIHRAIG